MESHAEGGVDRMVHERFFGDGRAGVMVDVGAALPGYLSVSALFRQLDWRVIAVEPNPAFAEAQRAAGNEVLEYACSDRDADGVPFELVDSHGQAYRGGTVSFESFSSLAVKPSYRKLKQNLDIRVITVDVRRLDTLLAEHAPEIERLDLVSVDTEGWELEVLNGLSFDRYTPAVVIVENLFNERGYRRSLAGRGYLLWRRKPPNDVYVRAELLTRGERAAARVRAGYWAPVKPIWLRYGSRRSAARRPPD